MGTPRKALIFLVGFACLAASSCASRTSREQLEDRQSSARPRAAAYGADGFYNDGDFPARGKPAPETEFFFKHCSLGGRHPYPSVSDWECSEPR